jgi:3-hydroxyanthranilate 3,4-dioxygenase
MVRRMMSQAFEHAAERGPYDDYPVLPAGIDPQLCLSRNDRIQPFYLICQKDTVLIQMSGQARIRLRQSSVNYFNAVPGDHIYIPAGTPHRIEPTHGEALQYRVKAEPAGLEAVAWACEACDAELWRHTWDTAQRLSQEGWLDAVQAFNDDPQKRSCAACGHTHPPVDLTPYRWRDIAHELRTPEPQLLDAW